MSANIVINGMFTKANKSLDGATKGKVLDFITKLQHNPRAKGLDLKMPKGAVDRRVRTARVSDFWRAVLFELPKAAGFVLASVKPHDDAYDYAARLKINVNEITGALEVVDPKIIEDITHVDGGAAKEPAKPLLAGLGEAKLKAFGMSDEVIARALTITDDDEFEQLCDAIPELQGCALLDLRAGKDPDEVYRELVGELDPDGIDTEDFDAALKRPSSRLSFASGTSEDLLAAIEGDLKAWRVWLHPQQRRLAYRDGWNGPFRVTGGAGTGKTVTALHRARHLAERAIESGHRERPVLLATFTRNLAATLADQLRELAGADVADTVEVRNLDAIAAHLLAKSGDQRQRIASSSDETVRQAWEIASSGTDWGPDFLREEWLDVVLANGISDRSTYLRVPRPGRGVALNRAKRGEVWGLIEKARQHLSVSGVLTHEQAAARAAEIASSDPTGQYRHVVVDEAQDLHPAHWRLIRALVPEAQDDLFIVGDAHQRIYGRRVVLSHFGIHTRGRSRRLTVNYRTSQQILMWSIGVMTGADIDDLDGESDSLLGARSEFTGPEPVASRCDSHADEASVVTGQVRAWIDEGYELGGIAVLAPTNQAADAVATALGAAGITQRRVGREGGGTAENAVQVMTMHRAKGLEFPAVAIVRLGKADYPPHIPAVSSQNGASARSDQARALLYVAGTRARERLTLVYTDRLTELAAIR